MLTLPSYSLGSQLEKIVYPIVGLAGALLALLVLLVLLVLLLRYCKNKKCDSFDPEKDNSGQSTSKYTS